MKKPLIPVLIVFSISLFFIVSLASANEYDNGYISLPVSLFNNPIDPQISCNSDGTQCVMIYWDDTLKGVYLLNSYNQFQTSSLAFNVLGYNSILDPYNDLYLITSNPSLWDLEPSNIADFYHLPYGVAYDDNTGKFMVSGWRLGAWTFEEQSGLWQMIQQHSASIQLACTSYAGAMEDFDDSGNSVWLYINSNNAPNFEAKLEIQYLNGTFVYVRDLSSSGNADFCTASGAPPANGLDRLYGIFVKDPVIPNWIEMDIWWNMSELGIIYNTYTNNTLNHPTTKSGTYYYSSSTLYYPRDNATTNYNNTWFGTTTNLDSYSANANYYAWDDANNEKIYHEDAYQTTRKKVYSYEKVHDVDTNGVYSYSEDTRQLRIISKVRNSLNPLLTNFLENVTAVVTCPDNSTTTGSGSDMLLTSFCTQNVSVRFTTSGSVQPIISIQNFDIPTSCEQRYTINAFFSQDYSFNLLVKDQFTDDPVVGANVTIDAVSSYTTGLDGIAIIPARPWQSVSHKQVQSSTCTLQLIESGVPFEHTLDIQATNYADYEELDFTYTDVFQEIDRAVGTKARNIIPDGAVVTVRVVDNDNVEREIVSGIVNISGNLNGTLYVDETDINNPRYLSRNTANTFPATFVLRDDRTNYTVIANLSYAGTFYNASILVNESLLEHPYYNLPIVIPTSTTEFACSVVEDCWIVPPYTTYCENEILYTAQGCEDNTCQYGFEYCNFLCDDKVGCYTFNSSTTCENSLDCIEASSCLSNYTSRSGICGSDGYCKLSDQPCGSLGCDNSTGYCFDNFACIQSGEQRYSFTIRLLEEAIGVNLFKTFTYADLIPYVRYEDTTVYDVNLVCSLQNTNTKTCISGYTLQSTQPNLLDFNIDAYVVTWAGSSSTPWQYSINETTVRFSDVSATCTNSCGLEVVFCEFGCNGGSGDCYFAPQTSGNIGSNQIAYIASMIGGYFPDPLSKMMFWSVLALLLMTATAIATTKFEIGAMTGLLWILVGLGVGWMPLIIGVLFIILAGIATATWITRTNTG